MYLNISLSDKNINHQILRTKDSSTQTSISQDNDCCQLSILDCPEKLEKENSRREITSRDPAGTASADRLMIPFEIAYTANSGDDEPTKDGSSPDHPESEALRTTSKSRREEMEKAELYVTRLLSEFEQHWQNLMKKLKQSGIEELNGAVMMTAKTSKIKNVSISAAQKKLKRDGGGGVVATAAAAGSRSPAAAVTVETEISHSESAVGDTITRHEISIEELKRTLQASVQEELQALALRLESQEQFWQSKLAYVQQDHEKQIQQLLQKLRPRIVENAVVAGRGAEAGVANNRHPFSSFYPATSHVPNEKDEQQQQAFLPQESKSQVGIDKEQRYEDLYEDDDDDDDDEDNDDNDDDLEERDGDEKNQNTTAMASHSSPPILLVGSRSERSSHKPNHNVQSKHSSSSSPSTKTNATTTGVTQDMPQNSDSRINKEKIPVAKPRKKRSNIADAAATATSTDCYVSSTQTSPNLTTSHRQKCRRESSKKEVSTTVNGTTGVIQQQQQLPVSSVVAALSDSESEYLTVIQPEETQDEKKHDNSVIEIPKQHRCRSRRANADDHPTTTTTSTAVLEGRMNKLAEGGNDNDGDDGDGNQNEPKSDVSDYTLSDSLDIIRVDQNDDDQNDYNNSSSKSNRQNQFNSKENSPLKKKTPPAKRKKYIFDKDTRKIVEVSSDYDDDDDDEEEENSSDISSAFHNSRGDSSEEEDETENNTKTRKSQVDLVREKTIMELEKNMADIGLNPESTAIGLEEMGRVLKHLKSKRRASSRNGSPEYRIHDQEQFEEERNAVKSFAKFAATKSSIDEKLEAISTLNPSRSQPSSFVKIFSAVKISGKNFRKRVASAVKKKQRNEEVDDGGVYDDNADVDMDGGGDVKSDKVRKRKSTAAPAPKTKFFSKDRWTRKKKADEAKATAGKHRSAETQPNKTGNKSKKDFYNEEGREEEEEDSEEEDPSSDEESSAAEESQVSDDDKILRTRDNKTPPVRKERTTATSENQSNERRDRRENGLFSDVEGSEDDSNEDSDDSQESLEIPSLDRQDLRWDEDESDIRLHQIKQFVNKNKKAVI